MLIYKDDIIFHSFKIFSYFEENEIKDPKLLVMRALKEIENLWGIIS